uniref:Uncharacterized protein n=1 Tax=Solanum lycopersicum TaxID=4081 RepID=A0A3Q7GUC3_SOLLC
MMENNNIKSPSTKEMIPGYLYNHQTKEFYNLTYAREQPESSARFGGSFRWFLFKEFSSRFASKIKIDEVILRWCYEIRGQRKSAIIIPEMDYNVGWSDLADKIIRSLVNPAFRKFVTQGKSFMDAANIQKWPCCLVGTFNDPYSSSPNPTVIHQSSLKRWKMTAGLHVLQLTHNQMMFKSPSRQEAERIIMGECGYIDADEDTKILRNRVGPKKTTLGQLKAKALLWQKTSDQAYVLKNEQPIDPNIKSAEDPRSGPKSSNANLGQLKAKARLQQKFSDHLYYSRRKKGNLHLNKRSGRLLGQPKPNLQWQRHKSFLNDSRMLSYLKSCCWLPKHKLIFLRSAREVETTKPNACDLYLFSLFLLSTLISLLGVLKIQKSKGKEQQKKRSKEKGEIVAKKLQCTINYENGEGSSRGRWPYQGFSSTSPLALESGDWTSDPYFKFENMWL